MEELTVVKDASWPDIENYIAIWEVFVDIKAFPSKGSIYAHEQSAHSTRK